MKVQQINTTNNIPMNGNLKIKGAKCAKTLRNAIKKSDFFMEKAKTNDVVTRIFCKITDYNGKKNEIIFKIKYSLLKENSLYDRVLDNLHLKPRQEYNKQYKSYEELIGMLEK